MPESDFLPMYVEETEEDKAKLQELVKGDLFPSLRKVINNRIAEKNMELYKKKELTNADRMDELLSLLSELDGYDS